ncbi:ribose 5-phosphate isomerase A [Mucilaginibacter pedocola]|uniref:Ribose 5-phosphate isomerase A n=1 Tax=Mucilaginibacter pedocola TaxID=1792845 RepID=A0A1S9PAK7_9SPHI|nr:ribose 5-phosphate isomerase A [Mucilaginibacter pedocola]OOQ57961.1 ribose 5-phosphate isomerase A [Mucilaginibacter pedocola]
MPNHKLEAAKAAAALIKPGQTVGLGAGSTIAYLIEAVCTDAALAGSVMFSSSSFKTTQLLLANGLKVQPPALLAKLDVYFDGCDQFDKHLNALKSGGGIHTTEKIMAAMADEFILIGDDSKMVDELDTTYPLVIEILPQALPSVMRKLTEAYPDAKIAQRISTQKDGALISDNGNYLADIYFANAIAPATLNTQIKIIPGIVEHSLFYQLAVKAIVAGDGGVKTVSK